MKKSLSILIYTVSSVVFQLPATVAVRIIGPRVMFSGITIAFGIITLVSLKNEGSTEKKIWLLIDVVYGIHSDLAADDRVESAIGDSAECHISGPQLSHFDLVSLQTG